MTLKCLNNVIVKDISYYYIVFYQFLLNMQASKTHIGDTVIRNYAPGEEGKFVNFDTVEFAEERAFPHLFPKGAIYLNYFL